MLQTIEVFENFSVIGFTEYAELATQQITGEVAVRTIARGAARETCRPPEQKPGQEDSGNHWRSRHAISLLCVLGNVGRRRSKGNHENVIAR